MRQTFIKAGVGLGVLVIGGVISVTTEETFRDLVFKREPQVIFVHPDTANLPSAGSVSANSVQAPAAPEVSQPTNVPDALADQSKTVTEPSTELPKAEQTAKESLMPVSANVVAPVSPQSLPETGSADSNGAAALSDSTPEIAATPSPLPSEPFRLAAQQQHFMCPNQVPFRFSVDKLGSRASDFIRVADASGGSTRVAVGTVIDLSNGCRVKLESTGRTLTFFAHFRYME